MGFRPPCAPPGRAPATAGVGFAAKGRASGAEREARTRSAGASTLGSKAAVSEVCAGDRRGWDSQPRPRVAGPKVRRGRSTGASTLGSNPGPSGASSRRSRGWDSQPRPRVAGPKVRRGCKAPEPPPWVRIRAPPGRAPLANGGGGIRTHVGKDPPVFKTGAISRSATPPRPQDRIAPEPVQRAGATTCLYEAKACAPCRTSNRAFDSRYCPDFPQLPEASLKPGGRAES